MPAKDTNVALVKVQPATTAPPARQESAAVSAFRTLEHKDELVIRADLPGLEKDDVKVNVAEDAVTIHGERHRAPEEEGDGAYRAERNYGAFHRTIPLPAGTVTDQAKASFKNGVLEIRMARRAERGEPIARDRRVRSARERGAPRHLTRTKSHRHGGGATRPRSRTRSS